LILVDDPSLVFLLTRCFVTSGQSLQVEEARFVLEATQSIVEVYQDLSVVHVWFELEVKIQKDWIDEGDLSSSVVFAKPVLQRRPRQSATGVGSKDDFLAPWTSPWKVTSFVVPNFEGHHQRDAQLLGLSRASSPPPRILAFPLWVEDDMDVVPSCSFQIQIYRRSCY
jgi:hypothetical protein